MMSDKRQKHFIFSERCTDQVDDMLHEYFKNPIEISLARSGTPFKKKFLNRAIPVENFNTKLNLIVHQLDDKAKFEKVLIFANNKKTLLI